MQYCKLSLAVPDMAGDVLGLALQGLDVFQESGESRTRASAIETSRAEQLAVIDALESHGWELLDKNWGLEHRLVLVTIEKGRHEAQEVESTKAVTDAGVELANAKVALGMPESRTSVDRLVTYCDSDGRNYVQGELATTLAKFQVGKGAFLPRLTTLSDSSVIRVLPRLWCRNI